MAPVRSWQCRATTSATTSSPSNTGCPSFRLSCRRVRGSDDNCPENWKNLKGSFEPEYRKICTLFPAFTGEGIAINSDFLNGLPTPQAKQKIITWLEEEEIGHRRVNYKLRDWLFSRQRYWGEPFPILHEVDAAGKPTGVIRRLDVSELPLVPPDLEDFKPTGSPEGPLLSKATDWVNVTIDGKHYKRETNTMPQWAGSCWYYPALHRPAQPDRAGGPGGTGYWLPVDLYIGGAEHAVLHLLSARFWHKVLFDRGYVPVPRAVRARLVNQGMILGGITSTTSPRMCTRRTRRRSRR